MKGVSFSKILLGVLLLVVGPLNHTNAIADDSLNPYACILNFERKTHTLSTTLTKKLSGMEGVRLINEAMPVDILKCLNDGASSLMIIGHAADLESKNQTTSPLLYFKELKGEDRKNYLDQIQKQLDNEVAEINNKFNELEVTEYSYYYKIVDYAQRLKKIPSNQPIYTNPKIVENQIFKRILNNSQNLKKISIISCLPEKVAAYYPELNELKQQGIEVEFAPKNRFMSFIKGKNVTSPDYAWIIKNLNESRP